MSETEQHRKQTMKENDQFFEILKVYELNDKDPDFDQTRYVRFSRITRKMSRSKRSVVMIKELLNLILVKSDAEQLKDEPEKQFECIAQKFKVCADLALSCKISLQDMLRHSSSSIHGKITYLLMLCGESISIIDYFIGVEFFLSYILPKAWFYMLNHGLITAENLNQTLLKIKWNSKHLLTKDQIKANLFECIAKIAYTSKLIQSQKKQMIASIKTTFQFEHEQELISLYNSQISTQCGFFESRLLICLMKRLGLGNNYFLEKFLSKSEKQKTLVFYNKNSYLQSEFFRKKNPNDEKAKSFMGALDFLNKEFKRGSKLQDSDFSVCFLDAFHYLFPDCLTKEKEKMKRQSILLQFIRTIDILLKNSLVDDEFFRKALVMTSIYVLRIGIEKQDTVELSIFAMQILLNAIGMRHTMQYIDRFFSLAVHAYLNFTNNKKIQKYTAKIFDFYIKEKANFTMAYFKDVQFVLLKKLRENPLINETVAIIANELYKSPDDIVENLKNHVYSLQSANEDIRILSTMYILELLEQQEHDEIRKVLVSPEVLKIVYQSILELRQSYKTENSRQLSIICAKCIASIGLCQPFVNDPLTLKATNQETLITRRRTFDPQKPDHCGAQNLIKSDHYNPVTNLKYKVQEEDNTLDLLAVPSFNELQVERKDVIKFAEQLLAKIMNMTVVTQEKPKNYYFTQFLLDKFINAQRQQENSHGGKTEDNQTAKDFFKKQDHLAKSVKRFADYKLQQYATLQPYQQKQSLQRFALYLMTKIEENHWKDMFEACIPLIKKSNEVLEMLLPYLIYYSLRFSTNTPTLYEEIASHINEILDSDFASHIEPILRVQEFLKICLHQDKMIFKVFIENQTKFKYVEKLFYLDFDPSKAKDQNIQNFIKCIENNADVKVSFLTVKKIKALFLNIDKFKKVKGAKFIKNYKRCVYHFEDHFRGIINSGANQNKGFLDILNQDQTIEVVNLHKQLNPEDFDQGLFNSIITSYKAQQMQWTLNGIQMQYLTLIDEKISKCEQNKKNIQKLFKNPQIIEEWKNNKWDEVQKWFGDINILELDSNIIYFDRESDNPIQQFEIIIAIFVAEYSKGLKSLVYNGEILEKDQYLLSLEKIDHLFKLLYHEFMLNLDEKQGEISYYFKLFLHVIYEIESAVHYMKDKIFSERDRIFEILKKEVNKDKRKFEKVYYEFDMNKIFEKLLSWFEERSQVISSSTESLKLIYYTRRMIFGLYDRENEYAFYLMKISQIYRKSSNDILTINRLLKECEQFQHKIIDYDLEYAKYTLKSKNAHEAYQYLQAKLDPLKKKCDEMFKVTAAQWMPQRVYERANLLSLELQIKLDPKNPNIIKRFDDFIKDLKQQTWEKPLFKYAQYLDNLDINAKESGEKLTPTQLGDQKKRMIQKIFYYITSLKHGHKYIWQSLPRALELWFDYNDIDSDVEKINTFMKQELNKLEIYKLATVLQIFLSRYGHQKEAVRDTIILVLAKIAVAYPGQCAWWIYHFLYFEQETTAPHNKKHNNPQKTQVITRADFAKNLLNRILQMNEVSYKKIVECEKIFLDLKKLSEKNPSSPNQSTMEMPQTLQKVSQSNLVMPIEENLSPQLPPLNFKHNFIQMSLVCTMGSITLFNHKNAAEQENVHMEPQNNEEQSEAAKLNEFPAFKLKPVTISGFLPEAKIMLSKEKPKKIGIMGSDRHIYNFLLKCDKYGDLRKEQRFIDFAVLCNKMLENDSESRKRNLRLRTYAIVPLSRNTGLIEWIQNTQTLKCVIGDFWKKNNVKGEMQDIKNRAQQLKAGDSHTGIWNLVKEEIKPVMGSWMAEHFSSPEIWYEARINFIRSTAIWSMIGYVIGLGDRHGDNILIHNHTGEVTHVDFDCIFEKGAKLKIPEIVPFRLTQNIMDAFGIFKEKGVFLSTCEVVQRVLRKNSSNIISFLYSFIHDPLIESTNNIKVDINQALEVVKKKLYGQINEKGGSMTIEEQVEQVILNALNDESLSKMYVGWMPWL